MGQYLPILMLGVLAGVFGVVSVFVSHLMAPKNPNSIKQAPYECGVDPIVEPPERFPVKFFLVAMIFIVFDVEIIFFYPWAVAHGALGLFGLVAVLIFSFAVLESFIYLISKGALNWAVLKQGIAEEAPESIQNGSGKAQNSFEPRTIQRIPNKISDQISDKKEALNV